MGFPGIRYSDSRWAGGLRLTTWPPEALSGPHSAFVHERVAEPTVTL
jgi:hypothetical protein